MTCSSSSVTAANFYPRPPRGGRPSSAVKLSTSVYFYPRPPRGGRHDYLPQDFPNYEISIHALREEGDEDFVTLTAIEISFLSTPSARRATKSEIHTKSAQNYFYPRPPRGGRQIAGCVCTPDVHISIHALREEGDPGPDGQRRPDRHFYPRPPRGGRLWRFPWTGCWAKFLSTPSARRATGQQPDREQHQPISIHALREEGDPASSVRWTPWNDFYPRPPRGGRPKHQGNRVVGGIISIHALREEGDATLWTAWCCMTNFYPRPPRGGRHAWGNEAPEA